MCIVFQNHDSFLLPLFPSKYGRSGVCIIEMHGMATEPVNSLADGSKGKYRSSYMYG